VKQEDEAIFEEESFGDNSINEANWDDSDPGSSKEENTKNEPDWSPRFNCPTCLKSFSKQSALSTHELSHLNLRNFECTRSGCKSAFNVLSRLIRHMRNVHSAEEDEIEIVKETSRKKNLPLKLPSKEIQSKQTKEKTRVQCSICKKELSNVKYLKEHLTLQHFDNAPYVCDKKGCGKKFVDHSLYEKHAKKHDGNFEYKCKYCTKGFVQRKTLNQHLRKSHQITQDEIEQIQKLSEKCAECGLIFKTSQKLSEHRAFSHNLGSKYVCDFCGKIFFSRVVLISHQKYHQDDKNKNKKCSKCPSSFTELKGLKTHMRRVHKMSEVDIFDIFMKP
jgi:KRAB domain-containing zinc finger protein